MHYIFITITLFLFILVDFQDKYDVRRKIMVRDQIAKRGIENKKVLESLRSVKRHLFVPANVRERAYADNALPIGYGQTISQPYIVALMTELINPKPDFKVLEIGTGSGYQAAILAKIVDQVYTIEIVTELGENVAKRFESMQISNVKSKIDDGYYGWEEYSPFDAIVVTAASEHIPPPLIQQLKPGGKMIIPVGSPMQVQTLMLVEKNENGKIKTNSLIPVVFVPFTRKK